MDIQFSSILVFILGLFYLIMLPGYLIFDGFQIRDLDVIETLTTSFGIGVGVLTIISIALSLPGSVGLTALNLAFANAVALIAISTTLYLKRIRNKRQNATKTHQNDINTDG